MTSGSPETAAGDAPGTAAGAGAAADAAALQDELRRLHEAVAYWSPARWERSVRGAGGTRRAADVVHDLVRILAALGREAGSGVPEGREPEQTGVHALADQLAVVAGELLAAPEAAGVGDRARAAAAGARSELFG